MKMIMLLICITACLVTTSMQAQNASNSPYTEMNGKTVISRFQIMDNLPEDKIFLNALLWIIQKSTQPEERMLQIDYDKRQISVALMLENQKSSSHYRHTLSIKVSGNIITLLASDITYESEAAVIKLMKRLSFEKLQPDKKPKHKTYMDEFAGMYKDCTEQLLAFISTNQLPAITHWNEIKNKEVVKGMNQTECLLSFGKPASEQKQDDKEEWMYDTYTYLFFEKGIVTSIIK